MNNQWNPETAIFPHLQAHLQQYRPSIVSARRCASPDADARQVITFDSYGVSGHPNHKVLFEAAKLLDKPRIQVMTLRSPLLLAKFTGPLSLLWTRLRPSRDRDLTVVTAGISDWLRGVRAMLKHRSQLVWFRWLYLGFSQLLWVNELVLDLPR